MEQIRPKAAADSAAAPAAAGNGREFRPFVDSVYALSYDAFLAAGNTREAHALAAAAVAQSPGLISWRERLARTSEWTGHPEKALEQWLYVGGKRPDTVSFREALRMADMLKDHAARVRAWEGLARLRKLELPEWRMLIQAYDDAGDPAKGIERLHAAIRQHSDRSLLESLAALQLRSGQDEDALQTFLALAKRYGDSPDLALARAKILCFHGKIPEASAELEKIAARAEPEQTEYWRFRAKTAMLTQRYQVALQSYATLFRSGYYEFGDALGLMDLARDQDSTLALQTAAAGWKRFAYPDFLIYYLERSISEGRWGVAEMVLDRISPEKGVKLSGIPYYHTLVGQIRQHQGKADAARREFLRALDLDSESESLRAGFLWLLIEQNRMGELERYCRAWDGGVEGSDSLTFPLAVAFKLLRQDRKAVEYFRHLDDGRSDKDFPFLLNFGELLEQSGDAEAAQRTYARARQALRSSLRTGDRKEDREWMDARARWAIRFAPGDEAQRHVQELLRATGGAGGAKELALSWQIGLGANPEDAIGALQSRYAMKWSVPAWADMAVAIRRNDAFRVKEILNTKAAFLAPADIASAAAFLREPARARADALGDPARDGMGNAAALALASQRAPRVGEGSMQINSRNLFLERRYRIGGIVPLAEGTELRAALEERTRPRLSGKIAIPVLRSESNGELRFGRNWALGDADLSVGMKAAGTQSDTAFRGAKIVWRAGVKQSWEAARLGRFALEYAFNAPAEEDQLLELTGMKDAWRGEAAFPLARRMRLETHAGALYFYDRDRTYLGTGRYLAGDLEQRPIRPLRYGLQGEYRIYRPQSTVGATDNPLDLIAGVYPLGDFPQSYWQWNLHASWGEDQGDPARGILSPFLSGEFGYSRFLAAGSVRSAHWEPDFGLRGGLSFCPGRTQSLTLLGSYSQGIRTASEKDLRAETRYQYFLK